MTAAPTSLSPLARLLADLDAASRPVAVLEARPTAAIGAVLARDLIAPADVPLQPTALVDGHAVASLETVGASPYAPAIPSRIVAVAAGEPVPAGFDAVLPRDAVGEDFGLSTVQQTVAPGENLRRAGEDFAAGTPLAKAGEALSGRAAHLSEAIGIGAASVRRPRLAIGGFGAAAERAARLLAALLPAGLVDPLVGGLDEAVSAPADLRLLIGGAAIGETDAAVTSLDRAGRRLGHGLALGSAESLAWGMIGDRPALVLPERPEALLAARLAVIAPLLARMTASVARASVLRLSLARKIVSRVGLDEVALLAVVGDRFEPLGVGDLSWSAIVRADAFLLLPPESEGLAEGTLVAARPLLSEPEAH